MSDIETIASELGMSIADFEAMEAEFERQREEEERAAAPKDIQLPLFAPQSLSEAATAPKAPQLNLKRKVYRDGRLGPVLPLAENLDEILLKAPEWKDVLAYNELDCSVIKVKPPRFERWGTPQCGQWDDNDTTHAQVIISQNWNVEFPRSEIDAAVLATAQHRKFHPIRAALKKLEWDKTPRLETWLQDFLGAKDSIYTRAIGPKILIGAVARIMQPGCKLDTMPILEGSQGIRKSTVWKILAGREEWFSDTAINIGDKDSYQSLRGSWFIEFGEMAAVLKRGGARLEAAKAYLTASSDRYRPSYGRRVQTFERQCIFVGTTNEHDYLRDPTGNRRFWPIGCSAIDIEGLTAARDQLMAEAMAAFAEGKPWHLSDSESIAAFAEQAQRNEEDPWETLVNDFLESEPQFVTTGDILLSVVGVPRNVAKQPDLQRIGAILRRAGWRPRGNHRPQRWVRDFAKKTLAAAPKVC